jgi:hypothetical protein
MARVLTPFALGLGSAQASALGPWTERLARWVSVIGDEELTAGPAFSFSCHFPSNLAVFPGRRKRACAQRGRRRRASREKKEEEFSANPSKKMPANKIQFQTGDSDPFLFHRWQP